MFCKSCEPICELEITPVLYHLENQNKNKFTSVFSSQILQNVEINIVVHWKFWRKYGSVSHLFRCTMNIQKKILWTRLQLDWFLCLRIFKENMTFYLDRSLESMLLQKSFQPIVFSWGQSQLAAASWLRIPSEPLWKEFESCTTLAMEKKRNHGVARQKKISKGFELSERNSSWVALLHGNWTCSSITPHLSPGIIWTEKKVEAI